MTLDPKSAAALALHRFGLGPRPGQIASIASDPRGALLAELDKPNISRIAGTGLMDSAAVSKGAWWRLFTAILLHNDLGHLMANMTIGFVVLGLAMARYGATSSRTTVIPCGRRLPV